MAGETLLWYDKPAGQWTDALPLGNGRLGAMVYGGVFDEQIALNDDTLYSDAPVNRVNPDAQKTIPEVKRLIKQGRLNEAARLCQAGVNSTPRYTGCYLPLCNLFLRDTHYGEPQNYRRELDLRRGVATVKYSLGGANFTREYFVSAPDSALIIRLSCDKPGGLDLFISLMRRPYDPGTAALSRGRLLMEGFASHGGMRFCCMVQARAEGGVIETLGDSLRARGADSLTIMVVSDTSYRSKCPADECKRLLSRLADACYQTLLRAHEADYAALFTRASISLNTPVRSHIPTDIRLKRLASGLDDDGLIELYFNFGRYLLIACSRPGSQCANLQGIWNDSFTPPWESIYTININIQMNYWPAETCGLGELAAPLFDKIEQLRLRGREVAREMYNCRGFMAHHNVNLWGDCAPTGAGAYLWPFGAAWLCLHIWEHYLYTLDEAFLADWGYDALKEAVEFFADYLTSDDEGYLITGLTQSPENAYILPNGEANSLCSTCTMDDAILSALFSAYLGASELLNRDSEFADAVRAMREKLRPYRAGSKGQLLEWAREYEECEPGHRHMSHMFPLHPGNEITPDDTPELAGACRRSIELRLENGGGQSGWSRAWHTLMVSRLREAGMALSNLRALIANSTYSNMFDKHPPFQIDGNFGGTAAIAEMLLQSHDGVIRLLPAVDARFPDGEFTGLRARGGASVSAKWAKGRAERASITSARGGAFNINVNGNTRTLALSPGETKEIECD